MTVRTRFAPSPTGYLHIGGVRTALFNWLLARQNAGQFILRIDDTDSKRNVAQTLKPILDGFQWLGIDWDEGPTLDGTDSTGPYAPYFQSQRLACYQAAVKTLLEKGLAYKDYSTAEERAAEKAEAEREKQDYLYSRKWMAETEADEKRFEAEGRVWAVRLKMPRQGHCEFHDLVCGDQSIAWATEQDHTIQRNDGTCLYHLASVVDDHDFAITHVVRGVEHLSNTPRQIFILEGLDYQRPVYAHIPSVAETGSKNKLSKRKIEQYFKNRDFKKLFDQGAAIAERIGIKIDPASFNPVLVEFYEKTGFLPDALNNYLLLLGWSLDDKTENFSRAEMIEHFSLERVNKSAASFDPQKLSAFQARYMNALPLKQKVARCLPFLQAAGIVPDPPDCDVGPYLTRIVAAADDRIEIAGDILQFDDFFADDDDLVFEEKAFEKRLVKADDAGFLLGELKKLLVGVSDDATAEELETVVKGFCETQGIKIGQIIHALRVACTGKAAGFGMFDTMSILGPKRCIARIDSALQQLARGGSKV